MNHLEDEEIARLAEGHVTESERKKFLKHMAICEDCLNAVADTAIFVEEERRMRSILRLLNIKSKIAYQNLQSLIIKLKTKPLVPALATLVIILVLIPFFLLKKAPDNMGITNAKIHYIEESLMSLESKMSYGFSQSKNPVNAAIRAGYFTEDLKVVLNSPNKDKLRSKISERLVSEFKVILMDDIDLLLPDLEREIEINFRKALKKLLSVVKKKSLYQPYELGRFVEGSILNTFGNKVPKQKEIEKYLRIAQKYNLPQGVLTKLEFLKTATGISEKREIFEKIKEVF
ncbi:MAG: hypothetical protein KAT34_16160 [Candidatus Aminicenantes bacterium]|nr:hypothetical protein [Candidatus Aminicenantes bacterium]